MSKDQIKNFLNSNKKLEKRYDELDERYKEAMNNNEIPKIQFNNLINKNIKIKYFLFIYQDIIVNNTLIEVVFDTGNDQIYISKILTQEFGIKIKNKKKNIIN